LEISKVNVLTVNATVIIGLIILFTFQSISSSFIETESSTFILSWHKTQNELDAIDFFLGECNTLNQDRDAYEKLFLEEHTFYDPYSGDEFPIFDNLSKDMEVKIKGHCENLVIKGLEKSLEKDALDELGYGLNYLSLFDEYGNEYSNLKGDDYYIDIPDLSLEESTYFHAIATGPLWVNITNMIMIFPFTVSAVIISVNLIREKESVKASKASVLAMAAGFIIMIFGFVNIVNGILTVYEPFIPY
jgi:hypothetical protein